MTKKRDIIVIGSSAGGVHALQQLVASLPHDFEASIFIVQHVSPNGTSFLPEILSKHGHLKAVHPKDNEHIRQGCIYIAPPDCHMLIEGDKILVKKGPKENRFRPSIDALFCSAAYNYGPRVIGVVLTGMLDDGTSGMWSVKRLGGLGIIQEPDDAQYPAMPTNVLEYVNVDYIVPLADVAALLVKLIQDDMIGPEDMQKAEMEKAELERMKIEIDTAAQRNGFERGIMEIGDLTPLTCPECHGVLVRLKEGNIVRYRCHTGHSYHANSLLSGLVESVEIKLYEALKSLEETVLLLEESAMEDEENGDVPVAHSLIQKAQIARKRAIKLREFIFEQAI